MTAGTLAYIFWRKIALHSIFWFLVLSFFSYFLGAPNENLFYSGSFAAFLLPVTMATTYTTIYYLLPGFLLKKKYLLFSLYSFYTLVLSAFAIVISIFYGFVFMLNMDYHGMPAPGRSLLSMMVLVYLVVILVSAFILLKQNYSSIAENRALENKFLEAQLKLKEQELHYLKLQVHPHFLFNTLNTLYGHALKKSIETPDMILKLSNLLDYLLYQADKPLVSLSSEIEHIKDYISLEQIRFRDNLLVDLDLPAATENIEIPPMLLIPFVENSFKHGQAVDGKLKISIRLQADKEHLQFTIKNSVKDDQQSETQNGLGLKNLKKRLQLLYPDTHSFSAEKIGNSFEAHLSLIHSKVYLHG
ncbi:histidine kinase [Antarcticibacterium flavum]|uniref:Histidine kinase n=2 Tax=Flavobacteriaceae TaxID=49546 RepID=A0A5B7X9K2_9FLAO|nr:histidine kinase [Antarcticibacterium sp. W02-3]QCY71482.1 histidine kinase [Antarcticibacterium flavum]